MISKKHSIYKFPLAILLLTQFLTAVPVDLGSLLGIIWFIWIFFCSLYAFFICSERMTIKTNRFAIVLLAFWLLNLVSYYVSPKVVMSFSLRTETIVYFKSITIALLSFFPFYYYFKDGVMKEDNLRWFIVVLFLTSVLRIIFGNILETAETYEEHNVLNEAYLFPQLIPLFLLCFRGKRLYLFIALSSLFVLWGAKRGAILCMAVNLLVIFFYLLNADSFGKNHRGRILLLITILVAIGAYFILGNEFLQERLLSTGSANDRSGEIRSSMYLMLFETFINNSTQSELLFGRGLAQTVDVVGNLAHQDWLELLIDNGIVGLGIYVLLIGMCIKTACTKKNNVPKPVKFALICCVVDWLLTASYSMVYASRDSFILFVTLGIINGYITNRNKCILPLR